MSRTRGYIAAHDTEGSFLGIRVSKPEMEMQVIVPSADLRCSTNASATCPDLTVIHRNMIFIPNIAAKSRYEPAARAPAWLPPTCRLPEAGV